MKPQSLIELILVKDHLEIYFPCNHIIISLKSIWRVPGSLEINPN